MEVRDKNKKNRLIRRSWRRLALLCLLALLLVGFWRYSAIGEYTDPEALGELLDRVSASPIAGAIVVGVFVLGSFVVFPATALIAATGLAFDPWQALLWASVGTLAGAVVNYCVVRLLPQRLVDRWFGPWTRRMGRRFERGGIVSIMIARNVPIAPFTLVNVVAGAVGIRFRDYLIGTILGMAPTILALTILGEQLRGAWTTPTLTEILLLIAAIGLWFGAALSLQALSNRFVSSRPLES